MTEGIDEGLILKEAFFAQKNDDISVHTKVNKLFPEILISLLKGNLQ